jgi:hypothetical protein
MAAPAPTARGTPTGIKLVDGYQSLITFGDEIAINLWEKQVTPPGIEGGEPIDQTTMHNVTWRSQAPRSLKELLQTQMTVAYDPGVYDSITGHINVIQTFTVTFADGTTYAFWGWLRSFVPAALVEGTQPEATCIIEPGDQDEDPPVLTNVAGT